MSKGNMPEHTAQPHKNTCSVGVKNSTLWEKWSLYPLTLILRAWSFACYGLKKRLTVRKESSPRWDCKNTFPPNKALLAALAHISLGNGGSRKLGDRKDFSRPKHSICGWKEGTNNVEKRCHDLGLQEYCATQCGSPSCTVPPFHREVVEKGWLTVGIIVAQNTVSVGGEGPQHCATMPFGSVTTRTFSHSMKHSQLHCCTLHWEIGGGRWVTGKISVAQEPPAVGGRRTPPVWNNVIQI